MSSQSVADVREEFQQVAAEILADGEITCDWTHESREGTADNARRHITAPDIAASRRPTEAMSVFLHECGEILAPRDHPVGVGAGRRRRACGR